MEDNSATNLANQTERIIPCPRCEGSSCDITKIGNVEIDICGDCGGIWFDAGELETVLGKAFDYTQVMKNLKVVGFSIDCPACSATMELMEFKSGKYTLEIDHCTKCQGFWLDDKELEQMFNMEDMVKLRKPSMFRPVSVNSDFDLSAISALDHYQTLDQGATDQHRKITFGIYMFCLLTTAPVELYNPRRKFPVLIFSLIVTNFLLYFMFWFMPGLRHSVYEWFGMTGADILRFRKPWTLVTYAFLHADFMHVFVNMYVMWVFADNVYDVFLDHGKLKGTQKFLFFYAVTAVIAGLAHAILTAGTEGSGAALVGASGVTSAMLASYWRLFPRSKLFQVVFLIPVKAPVSFYAVFWVITNLLLAWHHGFNSMISWQAHIGGFLAGYFLISNFIPYQTLKIAEKK